MAPPSLTACPFRAGRSGAAHPGLEKGVARDLLAAVGDQEEDRRIVRGAEQLLEQERAVTIAPLEVVDRDDERPLRSDGVEQGPQGRHGLAAHLLRISWSERLVGGISSIRPNAGNSRAAAARSGVSNAVLRSGGRASSQRLKLSSMPSRPLNGTVSRT